MTHAYDSYALSKGISANKKTPLTGEEIDELREWMDEDGNP